MWLSSEPSAGPVSRCQALGKEMRGRLGNGQLVTGEYEGMYQVSIDNREEWRMQVSRGHAHYPGLC